MSDRWRRELAKVDDLDPPLGVLDEARSLPPPEPNRPSTRSRVVAGVVAFVVFGAAIALLVRNNGQGSVNPQQSPTEAFAPHSFVAAIQQGGGEPGQLVLMSATDGSVLRTLHSLPWDGMAVSGTAIGPGGDIWVTLSSGARCTNGTAGCGPVPNSCASEVVSIDPQTGAATTILRGTNDEVMEAAVPSPDGTKLAYLQGGCVPSYFNEWITVRDLQTGRTWRVGDALPRCHGLGPMQWTADSSSLVTPYAEARSGDYNGPEGTCTQPMPSVLAVVPASASSGGLPGTKTPADPGCQIDSVAVTDSGYAAIERCGTPGDSFIDGPVRLVRYSPSLDIVGRTSLGKCEDGASLAADASGRYLIASLYEFCNPPGKPGPKTYLFTDMGSGVEQISSSKLRQPEFLSW